jgi:hypothetical protein
MLHRKIEREVVASARWWGTVAISRLAYSLRLDSAYRYPTCCHGLSAFLFESPGHVTTAHSHGWLRAMQQLPRCLLEGLPVPDVDPN